MKRFISIIVLLIVVASLYTVTSLAEQKKIITNSIGMEFVLVPSGEFYMGSPSNEKDKDSDEGPDHRVKISKAFYMSKYEVTQKQWNEVMGYNPSNFKGDNLPVEKVSWNDVQSFIKKLNDKEGENKYRLPSEAEWEYAGRAGTKTRYFFGDDASILGDYEWYNSNSGGTTHPVGQKNPNPWGLYDMYGNILEWVQDTTYHTNYDDAPIDGSAWGSGGYSNFRIIRGSSWYNNARGSRSANREILDINDPGRIDVGFRIIMNIESYSDKVSEVTDVIQIPLKIQTNSVPKASVEIYGTKTDVKMGEDVLLKVSAVSLITKPKMYIQVILVVPPGFSVTGMDYVKSSSNQYTSNYEVQPGDQINVDVNVKPNQEGDFNFKGKIIYYFGEDKENGEYEERDLPIKVRSINYVPRPTSTPVTPGFAADMTIIGILFIALSIRKRC